MSAKHVHFLNVPSSPASTFSVSSIASSSSPGPSTPPPVPCSPPSRKSSLSSLYPAPTRMHPILSRTSKNPTPLSWDMSLPAESAHPNLPHGPRYLTESLVSEAATHPPLPSISIICNYLPWTIAVTPTPSALWSQPYVTVGDVLHTLFRTLRLGVTERELDVLDSVQQDCVRSTYVRRYRRVTDPREREVEKVKLVKRIDFLRDHRAFLGLSLVPFCLPAKDLRPGEVWALHVARS